MLTSTFFACCVGHSIQLILSAQLEKLGTLLYQGKLGDFVINAACCLRTSLMESTSECI